jgi:serine protease Do
MPQFRFFLCLIFFSSSLSAVELPDFTDLINQTSPAVVKINVQSVNSRTNFSNQNIPDFYRDFFGYNEPPVQQQSSVGSGFIISEDGYLITNNHVVAGADEILVRLSDRQEFFAEIIGADEQSDLALLKIDGENLPIVKFADPEGIEVGDWVLAIGSPFDLDYSASAGIVSAIGRSLPNGSGQNYVPFIQTDVAINPGNSGGPLFNLDGEVVGVNSQIYTRSGGYMGLSFAIPAEVAIDVTEQLRNKGSVSRGWLGVFIQDISQDLATSFGLDRPHGALVSQVANGSPAERSGLLAGDVIVAFDGQTIEYSHDLPHVVGLLEPGSEARAIIYREGRRQSLNVELGALPTQTAALSNATPSPNRSSSSSIFGMELSNLSRAQANNQGLASGVIIDSVEPNSPAAEAGLRAEDIIVQLGFSEVSNLEDFRRIASNLPSGKVQPIRFYRDGEAIFRTIDID